MPRLRAVFYDPGIVDLDDRLTVRAFEACDRADVNVFAVEDGGVEVHGERCTLPEAQRVLNVDAAACIAVGAALRDAPVGAVWVGPTDLDVRGPTVRVAEEDALLFYDAVISELAERRLTTSE